MRPLHSRRQVLAGLAALAAAAAFPAFPALAAGAAPRHAQGCSAAFDAQGRLWVAFADHGGIVLQWSADTGKTWSPARQILPAPESVAANGESRPKIAFGPAGQIYVSYTAAMAKPHTGNIRFVRSTDGGHTFSAPFTVQSDRGVTAHSFDAMQVDQQGRIFIAWLDKRDQDAARAAARQYRGLAIYYAVSTDDGATFGPDTKLADHTCECCRIAIAADSGGRVAAMWRHIYEPNIRDHAMAWLDPAGTPGTVLRASEDGWKIDACPHHGPSFSFDGQGTRHQAWFSAAGEDGGLFYAAGSGKPVRIGGPQAGNAEVAASGKRVTVAWKEFDGSSTYVFARISEDGGATWSEHKVASTAAGSDHPHLAQHRGAAWLVWRTADEGFVIRNLEPKT